ncbi:hypothetical protein BV22DRAFT_747719 [Leucogyrophana mollusca]|uniref:Uncharacterized protein n=1 Tax=Leucogyrophana mollusca TaxID=85980 RepID=A0ACB8B640_9AGAM|nr:hypothetical protein BV22DRAFT_747719 [Leucogyrophana mollusca]
MDWHPENQTMSVPIPFVADLWVRRAFGVAGYTILVWDYILTFADEVRYIWMAPWTLSKALFLVNRYGNLASQTFLHIEETGFLSHGSQKWCHRFNVYATIYLFVATESIHILVLLRAWAIWGCTPRVAAWLISIYAIYSLLVLAMTVYGTTTSTFQTFQYLEDIGVCVAYMPPYLWTLFFPSNPLYSFALDTSVFAITMRSLRKHSRACRHLYPSQLLQQLFKDAITFFLVNTFNNAFVILVMWTLYAMSPKNLIAMSFSTPLLSVAGQRLVLNLRGLRTQTYSRGQLSREVDRQIMAFQDVDANHWHAPIVPWGDDGGDDAVGDGGAELTENGIPHVPR